MRYRVLRLPSVLFLGITSPFDKVKFPFRRLLFTLDGLDLEFVIHWLGLFRLESLAVKERAVRRALVLNYARGIVQTSDGAVDPGHTLLVEPNRGWWQPSSLQGVSGCFVERRLRRERGEGRRVGMEVFRNSRYHLVIFVAQRMLPDLAALERLLQMGDDSDDLITR